MPVLPVSLPWASCPRVSRSVHQAWDGMTTQRKQLPPNKLFLTLSRVQADPPSRDCSTKKGLSWCHQCPHLVPPQDTVDDARIRSISDFSPQLKTQDTEQLKTIRQRQQQLNNRPVPEQEAVGLGEGAEGPTQTQPYTLCLRWNSFHGNLLRYQQQLEVALEIHTLSQKLDDITQQVRKKVSSGGADEARGPCLPPLAHLSSSAGYLEAGPTRGPSVGLPGALRVNSGPRSPNLLLGGWPHLPPFSHESRGWSNPSSPCVL